MKVESISSFVSRTNNQKGKTNSIKEYYINRNNLSKDTVSFGSKNIDEQYQDKFKTCKKLFTLESDELYENAKALARKYNSQQVREEHLFLASLLKLRKYMKELDNGASYNSYPTFYMPSAIESISVGDVISDNKKRKKIEPAISKHIKTLIKELEQEKENNKKSPLFLHASKGLMQTVVTMYEINELALNDNDLKTGSYNDALLFGSLAVSRNKKFAEKFKNFRMDLLRSAMTDTSLNKKSSLHLNFYDDKADKLWKNLDIGNDMFVIYDGNNKVAAKHLLSSFKNLINRKDIHYKNLNKDNTKIIIYNEDIDFDLVNDEVAEAKKDKDNTYIFVMPFSDAASNTGAIRKLNTPGFVDNDLKTLKNEPNADGKKNIRIVFTISKDVYFNNKSNGTMKDILKDYGQIAIPMVNIDDAKEMLTDPLSQEFLENMTKKPYEKEAIIKAVEFSNAMDGYYPEKAIQLMTDISLYYAENEKITAKDVESYIEETREISRTNNADSEFKITFNTGKTLDDIVGSPMTKAEAKSVVDQIKYKTVKTKGMTVFLDNGTSYGGGRHHTAEAIAGEAEIPMITINARDFALKDIDALAQNASLSEIKIQKLISVAKSQAESNKNKTAMVFIENFDNFGSDPVYGLSSIYEQKAFSQLLREMENLRKNEGINLLIVGSVNRPELLDEDIMKPYKFLDKIIIYSPQDTKDRIDILNYYIEKQNLAIAGKTKEEKDAIIKHIAETTAYFSVVDLMYLLDKAVSISKEEGKNAIDRGDFTEAFLQTTTGRVSTRHSAEHDKEIVTAHECGHAITLQIMHELAQKAEKPWHLPDKVDFITLDPRGEYRGAMYHKASDNEEYSFEKIFASIVCSYGGHSSEKEFYNMEGSWGITGDMDSATHTARVAVEVMGLGPKTGRISIKKNGLGLSDVSERIRNNIFDDIELILKNANYVSDRIVHTYSSFIEEFTQNYKDKVGTGECIISSEEFKEQLENWKERQSEEKLKELEELDNEILLTIKQTRNGEFMCK